MKDFYRKEPGKTNIITDAFIPLLIYYVIHNASVILGLSVMQIFQNKMNPDFGGESVLFYVETLIKMAGMALGGLAVYPYYKREKVSETEKSLSVRVSMALIITGALLSLGTNFLFAVTGLTESSQQYQKVAETQFALPLGLAVLFYGIVSPVVEEMVFRGIAYNALSRHTTKVMGIVGSALLFGAFHGNLIQMLYGSLMGVVMAYVYQKYRKLSAPVLFHGAANIAVYVMAYFF